MEISAYMRLLGAVLFSLVMSWSTFGQTYTIHTVAGNGTLGYSGDNGSATSAQLAHPWSVAVDSAGSLYITDYGNNRIRKVSNGVITTVAGNGTPGYGGDNGPATSAPLSSPQGVAVDSAGNLYIADLGNNRIRKVSNGVITTVAGTGPAYPGGGFSGDGGPATSAQLYWPVGVAVDSAGNLYIAEVGNERIRRVSNGVITTVAGNGAPGYGGDNGPATSAPLYSPQGVAVDSAGNLYIADYNDGRIRKVSNGVITTVAGNGTLGYGGDNGPATSAELYFPNGVAVDSAGNLYIADSNNQRIRKVSNGVITTIAGNGGFGFSGDDGPATSAQLYYPMGVAVDSAGNVYIADDYNSRIRMLGGPTITTTSLPFGIAGIPYSATLSATNGTPPYTWTTSGSSVPWPAGLNLNAATGLISGTPSVGTYNIAGGENFQFQVTDSKGISATATLSLVIYNPLTINPGSLPQGSVGTLYVQCITATGGVVDPPFGAYATVTISGGSLPAGLTLGNAGPVVEACSITTGHSGISGTPTQSGTFPLVISVTDGIQVVTKSMTLVIAAAPTLVVSPSSLAFQYQFGGTAAVAQTVTLTIPSGTIATYSISASTDNGGRWLQVPSVAQSTTGGTNTFQVSASTATNQAGTFTGKITISSPQISNSPVTIPVTFTVTAAPTLIVGTLFLSFSYSSGATASQRTISVSSSQGTLAYTATASTTSGGSWLSVTPSSGTTPSNISVLANPAGLPVGNYAGSILISANTTTPGVSPSPATNSPQTVTVTMTVTQSSTLGVSPTALSFAYQTGGPAPNGQTLAVSSSGAAALSFTATASTYSGGNWLLVTPNSGTTPAGLSISVNPSGLGTGTYSGSITISSTGASNSPQTVSVTLTVSAAPALTITQSTLGFSYQTGAAVPGGQNVPVGSSGAALIFSDAASTASGGNWLTVSPSGGTTPANLSISVNPAGLGTGMYLGSITISATGASNSPQSISVTLTVTSAATISISPSLLNFAYQSGGNPPQAQAITVSATSAAAFTAAASGGSWLAVNPTSGITPASLSVSVSPVGLNPGIYNGTITVTGTNGAQGMSIVNVILTVTVTVPLPTIISVTNAASYATGAISPGELVTLFGTNIGPAIPAYATTDQATGKLATAIGGVQVLFNGMAAPMIYASSTQVSAVVPYETAGIATPPVWIKYVGQTSNAFQLTTAATAPGLFTQNSTGSGPGAILNQDNSVNGPGNRAAKGSIVQVFMTGEGQTSPPSVTGAITTATLPPPQVTPAPLLAVGVTINGQPALYVYAGEAPGLVAGMMQLNVQIPATGLSGDLQILVSIGGNTSQNGVTVSVQ